MFVDPFGLYLSWSEIVQGIVGGAKIGFKDAWTAYKIAQKALAEAKIAYPGDTDKRNAYQHCLGACRSTRAIGPTQAKEIQDVHENHGTESGGPSEDKCDSAIDKYNNAKANAMAITAPGNSCTNLCKDRMKQTGDSSLIISENDSRVSCACKSP